MVLLSAPQFVYAVPNFWLEYNLKSEVTSIKGASYLITENYSDCMVDVFADEISSFVRDSNGDIIVNTGKHGALSLESDGLEAIKEKDKKYLTTLLRSKDKMLFIGDRCGNGGYFIINGILKVNSIDGIQDRRKPAQHR